MTVKELRTLVNNLDEYIRIPGGIERLRKTILHLAVTGQLVPQYSEEGTGQELFDQIQAEKSQLIREGKLKKQKELPPVTADEEPFEIPSSWKWVRLGDVSNYGMSLKARPQEIPEQAWLLDLEDIEKDTSVVLKKVTASERASTSDKNIFFRGDVLYGKLRPYLNKVIIADDSGYATSELLPLRIYGSLGSPDYLKLYLKSPNFYNYVNGITYGIKMPRLGTEDGRRAVMPLPPIAEQIRIGNKVNEVFVLINALEGHYRAEEKTRNILTASVLNRLLTDIPTAIGYFEDIIKSKKDVKELENAILSLAIRGQIVEHDKSEGTGQELFDQIQAEKSQLIREGKLKKQKELPPVTADEEPFEIPSSWKWVRLADITNFSIGRTPRRVEDKYWNAEYMPWVSIADLNDQGYVEDTKEKISKAAFDEVFKGAYAPAGSLLYSFKLTIGKMSILSVDAVHNEAIASLEVHSKITRDYLFKALRALDPTSRTNAAIKGFTLNSGTLSLLEIPLPPLKEQERIVQKINEIFELTRELSEII